MASQSYRNRQEEQKNKRPTLEMRSLKRFEKMKFANLHLERQCRSELSSLHCCQERKLLDLRHDCHDLMKELQTNQYRLLSSKLSQQEQDRVKEEKLVKEEEARILEEKRAMAAKKAAPQSKSVMFHMDFSDSGSDGGYLSSGDEDDIRKQSGTRRNAPPSGFLPSRFSRGFSRTASDGAIMAGRYASSAQSAKKDIHREASILKRELSANPVLKGISLEPDGNLNEHTDGAMNLATRRLEKTRRTSMPPLVGHLPFRDRVEMMQVIQSRRRKSAPSRVGKAAKRGLLKPDQNFKFRPQTTANREMQDSATRTKRVSISTLNPGDQKIYIPKTLKEQNSAGDGQERERFMKLRKQQEIRLYNDILKKVDSIVLGTSTPRKSSANVIRAESEDMNPTEEAMLKNMNMNKLLLVAKMVGAARRIKAKSAAASGTAEASAARES